MSSNCEECKESNIWNIALDSNPILHWKTWIYQQKRPKQIMVSKPLDEAINELHDQTDKFKLHFFIKNVQSDYFQTEKQNLTDEKAIVQIDFAENYGLISQDEIQTAHWCHGQVTLFTCCIWMKDKLHSVIIISDELKHSKYAVHLFLQKILQYIKFINENITSIYIFSDNCAAQFKNRYVIGSMNALKLEYGVKHLEWNFFAASHGKGAVDGLGGSVKRIVWIAVKSRQALVNSAQDFFDVARSLCTNIFFIFVPKEDIDAVKSVLDDEWKMLKNIRGLQGKHSFQFEEGNRVSMGRTSKSNIRSTLVFKTPNEAENSWDEDDLKPISCLIHQRADVPIEIT